MHVTPAAVLTMALASLCMALMDAVSKDLVANIPAAWIAWSRYLVQVTIVIVFLLPRMKRQLLVSKALRLQWLRGAFVAPSSLLMVLALQGISLPEATAILFIAPVIVVILAVFVLAERMTVVRWLVVIAAMCGMGIVIRPTANVFQGAALWALAAAIALAVSLVLARKLASEDARATLFWTSLIGVLMMSLVVPWNGFASLSEHMKAANSMKLLAIGILAAVGQFLQIRAFQMAPASGIASISYVQIVFASVIGLAAFGTLPDAVTLFGMFIIIASGVLLAWHERRTALSHAAQALAAQ